MLSQSRPENQKRKTSSGSRRYTSKSCNNCRKRKAKCDGAQPVCSTCVLYKDACVYSEESDKRHHPKRGEIAALRDRIKTLEGLLEGTSLDGPEGGADATRIRTELTESEDGEDSDPEKDIVNGAGVSRLKLDEHTLELTAYGPTSAFQHLPGPPPDRLSASPLGTTHLSPPPSMLSSNQPDVSGHTPIYWNKYLPPLEGWDEALHDALLDLFFLYFNPWCYWIEEEQFRRDLRSVLSFDSNHSTSRSSHYSPLLHLVILAIACAYSDDSRASQTVSQTLVANAKASIDSEGERPTIATLRGFLLLGSWHSGNGLQGLGNLYSGIGFRMSQTLGLGIDSRSFVRTGVLSESLQRTRDYAMWTSYVQDKLWSSYVGRNPTLLLSVLDTPAPTIDAEIDQRPWKPLAGSQRRSPALSNLTSCFRSVTTLSVLQERILTTLYGLKANVKSASTLNLVSELNLKLESWLSKLPSPLQIPPQLTKPPPAHIILLNALYHFVTILLYRPYYNHQNQLDLNEVAVKRCNAASARIISLFELFEAAPGLRFAPVTLVQISFAAGTTQLLSSVNSTGKKASEAREAAQRCVVALREIGKAWKCGTQTAGILEKLIFEWAPLEDSPPTSTNAPPAPSEPYSQLAPHIEEALLRIGWQPPSASRPFASTSPLDTGLSTSSSSFPLPQPISPLLPSPPTNPLSLQNGFASAFSHPFPPHPHSQAFPPVYPPPTESYELSNAWFPQPSHSAGNPEPLPDDVFAAMLSYAGRDAMTNGDAGLGGTLNGPGWQF